MENLESKVIMENLTPEFVQKVIALQKKVCVSMTGRPPLAVSNTVRWRTFWTSQNRRLRNLAC